MPLTKAQEKLGWREGTAEEFLGLTDAEAREVELRNQLMRAVRRLRVAQGRTQREVAELAGTSQPRIVDIEAGGRSTLDLVFRVFFALGGTVEKLAELGRPLTAEEQANRVARPRSKATTAAKRPARTT